MAVLEIVHYGDPILTKKCKSVKDLGDINSIISDMFDSMYEAEGIGLAANQVGLDTVSYTHLTLPTILLV